MRACSSLPTCAGLFICVHACIVCTYIKGDGFVTESMAQIKRGDKKKGAEGSQGNLLLPGPRELVRGALSHLVSTCPLFAQATVIILMISLAC